MQLCASFRREAGRVWKQMEESSRLGLALSEETITETCLYNIARQHQSGNITVIPATRPQEAKHGADWEWWFTRRGRGVGYRVQAKRLFPSGRYESLFKKGKPLGQLEKLVSAAKSDGLDPLYCFLISTSHRMDFMAITMTAATIIVVRASGDAPLLCRTTWNL